MRQLSCQNIYCTTPVIAKQTEKEARQQQIYPRSVKVGDLKKKQYLNPNRNCN